MSVMRVSVADATNKLPELIKAAENGEAITICRRGTPVVDLVRCSCVDTPSSAGYVLVRFRISRRTLLSNRCEERPSARTRYPAHARHTGALKLEARHSKSLWEANWRPKVPRPELPVACIRIKDVLGGLHHEFWLEEIAA